MPFEFRLLLSIVLGGLIAAQIMNTWFNGSIFEKARKWIDKNAPELPADLMSCPLCLSHWVALLSMWLSTELLGTTNLIFFKTIPTAAAYWICVIGVANLIYYKCFHYEEPPLDPFLHYPLGEKDGPPQQ